MAQTPQTNRVKRPERVPVSGNRDILTVKGKDPAFEYRIVKDKPGRVQRFLDGGYEIVIHDAEVGDPRVGVPSPEGTPVKISLGQGEQGYLMRIPKELYAEDQKKKQDDITEREKLMVRQHKEGHYGTIEINRPK